MTTVEDKVCFLQSFITGKPFIKEYDLIGTDITVTFRTLSPDDCQVIKNEAHQFVVPSVVAASIAKIVRASDTHNYVPISQLDFNNDKYNTPIPQLIDHITLIFRLDLDNWEQIAATYNSYFIPTIRQLTGMFANMSFFNTDPIISKLVDLMYRGVLDIRPLDLQSEAGRNYLAILLNHNPEITETHETPTVVAPPVDAQSLIDMYHDLVANKNAKE